MLELEKSLPKGHHLSQQFINMHYGVDYTTRGQHTRDSPTRGFSAPVGGFVSWFWDCMEKPKSTQQIVVVML